MLTCKRMQNAALTSVLLLILGIILEATAQVIPFSLPTVTLALLSALAGLSVLSALGLLAVVVLLGLLPGSSKRLQNC